MKKGAFSEAEAEARFEQCNAEKQSKTDAIRNEATKQKNELARKHREAEAKAKEAIEKKVAEKMAVAESKAAEAETAE